LSAGLLPDPLQELTALPETPLVMGERPQGKGRGGERKGPILALFLLMHFKACL